ADLAGAPGFVQRAKDVAADAAIAVDGDLDGHVGTPARGQGGKRNRHFSPYSRGGPDRGLKRRALGACAEEAVRAAKPPDAVHISGASCPIAVLWGGEPPKICPHPGDFSPRTFLPRRLLVGAWRAGCNRPVRFQPAGPSATAGTASVRRQKAVVKSLMCRDSPLSSTTRPWRRRGEYAISATKPRT